jgi:hypothetical protein
VATTLPMFTRYDPRIALKGKQDKMKFISARIRPVKVYHGYDGDRTSIIDEMPSREFAEKVIRVDRILSVTEDYLFIECPHSTAQTWEYEGSLNDIKTQLRAVGMLIE